MPVNKKVGRPKATDKPDVVSLLVTSFHNGLNVREACTQSGISHEAYYNRLRTDEQFTDTMAKAQLQPKMNAKVVVLKAINGGDVNAAKWWLERKSRDEFGRDSVPEQEPKAEPNPLDKQYTDAEMAEVIEDYKKLTILDYKKRQMAEISKLGLPEPEKYSRYNELYALTDDQIMRQIIKQNDEQIAAMANATI